MGKDRQTEAETQIRKLGGRLEILEQLVETQLGLLKVKEKRTSKKNVPDRLSDADRALLEVWCSRNKVAAIRRMNGEVRRHEAACLDHFRASGKQKADWLATVRNWIRVEARGGPGANR